MSNIIYQVKMLKSAILNVHWKASVKNSFVSSFPQLCSLCSSAEETLQYNICPYVTREGTDSYSIVKCNRFMHKQNIKDSWKEGNDAMKTVPKYRSFQLQHLTVEETKGGLGFKSENWLCVKSYQSSGSCWLVIF